MIGRMFSHYQILKKLGQGATGVVYAAIDTRIQRPVAIKFLSASQQQSRAGLLEEARALSRLNHPNIAAVHDFGETPEGWPFVVMELVKGKTLSELLQRSGPSVPRAVEVVDSVAETLDEAHQEGIFHCEVMPSSVMLTERGLIKVLDFGWRSQLKKQKVSADARNDVFSLGTLLYESITGRAAFAKSIMKGGAEIIRVLPPAPSSINEQIPPELDRITIKALAPNPERRYPTAASMIEELRAMAASFGIAEPSVEEFEAVAEGPPEPAPSPPPEVGDDSSPEEKPALHRVKDPGRGFTRAKPPAHDDAKPPPLEASKKRVVSTGFAEQISPGKRLGSTLPLACNHDYYFWLEVGPPVKGAIDVSPPALPEFIPRDALLKVALFGFDHKLSITPGADVGEIKLETDGTARVVQRPVEPPGGAKNSRLFKKRLFFPVKAGDFSDHAQLRCNIYYEQVLVQSHLVRVRIMRRPESIKGALSTTVDYTLSRTLNPAHVSDLKPHRLSLMLNDNGNGTHGFRFFGEKEFKNDATFDGQELQNYINLARGALRLAAWGDEDSWIQGKAYLYEASHNPNAVPDLVKMKVDLVRLAIRGYRFYDSIISKLTDSVAQADELADLMRTPGMIQIALKQSARHVFPAAMIYDYPLDTNASAHTLCPSFLQSLNNPGLLEATGCFKGNCVSKDADTVICPSGFWGYRHSLGLPLSLKNAPDAPSELTWETKPQMTIGVSTDQAFVWRPAHEKALQALQPHMGWNYGNTRADVLQLLKANTSHLVYFYCHGGMAGTVPFIQVGPATERGITRDNLRREKIRWKSPRPLVFINGCHTAALEPNVAMEFISAFVEVAGASGVIGTEITIFEPLARAFAEEFLGRFLKGEKIGDAIRGSRLKLLKAGNPLGLVYIPYVIASLHMIEKPAH